MTSISQKSVVPVDNLVHCAITHRNSRRNSFVASVDIYSGMSTVRYIGNVSTLDMSKKVGRGQITGFSQKSRRRLMEALLKKSNYHRPLFVTLTYTDQSIGYLPAARDYKRDIDCFAKRLQRDYPNSGHIWRIEYQERKSKAFIGRRIPHYHLIIDGVLDDIAELRKKFRLWWHEIITDGHNYAPSPRVDVQPAKSKRHAMYYLSKYVAKKTDNNNIADEYQHNYFEGRHWAVGGNWEQTIVSTIKLTRQEYIDFRRLCVRWLKSRSSKYARGLAKSRSRQGFSMYGLGNDDKIPGFEATIRKMLLFVTEIYHF